MIGKRIQAVLEMQALDRADLAEKLGVSVSSVGHWITGKREPDNESLVKIAKFGNVTLDWLLTGEESTFKPPTSDIGNMQSTASPIPDGRFIPVINKVFAGDNHQDMYLEENILDTIITTYKGKNGVFGLLVEGDSMINSSGGRSLYPGDIAVIDPVQSIKPPRPEMEIIPESDLKAILAYFKAHNIVHYHLVNFLLLTGFRVSSAIAQRWDWINYETGLMQAYNKKANRPFYFPIYPELKKLVKDMHKTKIDNSLFHLAGNDSTKFWNRGLKVLIKEKKILKHYKLHSLRKTFSTRLARKKIDRHIVKSLLDHSSVSTTSDFYTLIDMASYTDVFK